MGHHCCHRFIVAAQQKALGSHPELFETSVVVKAEHAESSQSCGTFLSKARHCCCHWYIVAEWQGSRSTPRAANRFKCQSAAS
jgi:hypothetical protein